MPTIEKTVTCVGDLTDRHLGARVIVSTPHHGMVAGVLARVEWSRRGVRLHLSGAGGWQEVVPVRSASPATVAGVTS